MVGYVLWGLALAGLMVILAHGWREVISNYPIRVYFIFPSNRTEEVEGMIRNVFRQHFWKGGRRELVIIIAGGDGTFPIVERITKWGWMGQVWNGEFSGS